MTCLVTRFFLRLFDQHTSLFILFFVGSFLLGASVINAASLQLGSPIKCELGLDCFLQQLPDTNPSKDVSDSFCGNASYDGHKGTDIRLLTMEDVKRNVPVIASASGLVKSIRDGEEDKIVRSEADRKAIKNKECGNGVVIAHENGFKTQYCHLKRGSISVTNGQRVKLGDQLGAVGASGLAQFPHVHLTVRQNGKVVDPFTGKSLSDGCQPSANKAASLWSPKTRSALVIETSQIIAAGFSGEPVEHDNLVMQLPKALTRSSAATVGWSYFINLKKDDKVSLSIYGPDGSIYAENTSKPLSRPKATYSIFSGRKRRPTKGTYKVESKILRGDKKIATKTAVLEIK